MSSARLIAEMLSVFEELYGKHLSPVAQAAYIEALEDLSAAEVSAVRVQALKRCKFMPMPAELIAIAADLRNTAEGWDADSLTGEIMRLLDEGPYHQRVKERLENCEGQREDAIVIEECSPRFVHPLVRQVVEACGGWWSLRDSDPGVVRGQIRRAAEATVRRTEGNAERRLRGEEEREPVRVVAQRSALPEAKDAPPAAIEEHVAALAAKFRMRQDICREA